MRYSDTQRIILSTIAVAGVLSVALVAPGVIGAMNKLGLIPKRRQGEYAKSSLNKLKSKGLVTYNGFGYAVTKKGQRQLDVWQFTNFQLNKPKKWDGKWRVITFDIPEKIRKTRNYLTRLLRGVGFVRLQDSVWVYPYDCEDTFTLLKTDLEIHKHALYMIVDQIENDKNLRVEFGLAK